jgi:hypothetical protein
MIRSKFLGKCLFSFFGLLILGSNLSIAGDFIYPDNLGRDPFQPLIDKQGNIDVSLIRNKEDLVLNGIIFSAEKGESIAILNSESFREGTVIGQYQLKEIHPKKVLLIKGEEEIILKLEDDNER